MSDLTDFKDQLLDCVAKITQGFCPTNKVDNCNNTLRQNCYQCWVEDLMAQKSKDGLHLAIVKNREDLTGCRRIDECPYDEDHACKDCEFRQWFAEIIKE